MKNKFRILKIILNYKIGNYLKKFKASSKRLIRRVFLLNKKNPSEKDIKISLSFLNYWSRNKNKINSKVIYHNILVDCMWNNPNYWFRYSLVRKSLNLFHSKEFAMFGEHTKTLENLICNIFNFKSLGSLFHQSYPNKKDISDAIKLMSKVKKAGDFLALKLPYDFPPSILYDGILKRQSQSSIDLKDKNVVYYLAHCLSYLNKANKLFDKYKFDLIILSHCQEYTYASFAWIATLRNIPVYTLYGEFGTNRFLYLKNKKDLFAYPSRPNLGEINRIPEDIKKSFIEEGKNLVFLRFKGKTNDIGSKYAYINRKKKINKRQICKINNWDFEKPLIAVYCSNWFDYPHSSGLKSYIDFKDWIDSILNLASKNKSVNWLFKSHPCDDIYPSLKGQTIAEAIAFYNLEHISLASKDWNGLDIINSIDGITTCHGTIGIEATILGKPVLVPYKGWYGHLGFVQNASSKNNYLKLLNTKWYLNTPDSSQIDLCAITAAIYFGKSSWQEFLFEDDSKQEKIYLNLKNNIIEYNYCLEKEMDCIRKWFKSNKKYYQVYKKINS